MKWKFLLCGLLNRYLKLEVDSSFSILYDVCYRNNHIFVFFNYINNIKMLINRCDRFLFIPADILHLRIET